MENSNKFHHDEMLERAVDAVLREPIPEDLPPERVAQLTALLRQAAEKPYRTSLMERIRTMKPTTKIAVAASALIAFAGLLSWLVPGSGTAVAFADVAEALNSVHSATWKTTSVTEVKAPEEKTVTLHSDVMYLAPSHERTVFTADDGKSQAINIVDGQKNRAITLSLATKTATIIDFKNFPADDSPFGRTFQGLRELVARAESGKEGKVERLGMQRIDGRNAEGFRIQRGSIDVKLWADPKTLLPIRAEYISTDPKSSTVMTDFRFNVPLDKSLFSLEVPPGYTVQDTAAIDASKPWVFLTGALKMAAEFNGGVFPPSLRGEQGVASVIQKGIPTLFQKHKGSPDELRKLSRDFGMNLGGFLGFINAALPDAVHYAGKDVKLGTPDRPILWLTQKKRDKVLVIYADLSVKEFPADEAPKMPDSEENPGQ